MPVAEGDVDIVALVDRHDRKLVRDRQGPDTVEDLPGFKGVGHEQRHVGGSQRKLGRRGPARLGILPEVEVPHVGADERAQKGPVVQEHRIAGQVVRHAGLGIHHVGPLREGEPVIRLHDEDIVLSLLRLAQLPEAHVERLLAAGHVPLGDRNPVVPAVGRNRERGRTQPQTGHVDAAAALDAGVSPRGRDDGERIAQRDVDVAAAGSALR